MTSQVAVDKIILHAKRDGFKLHDIHSGLWSRQTIHQGLTVDDSDPTPWGTDSKGTLLYGTVQGHIPMGNTIIHVSANGHGMKVTTNPNKWVHPWELTATASQLPVIRSTIKDVVSRFASVNADDMSTQHIDLCRQASMNDDARKYSEALRICPPPRKTAFPEPGGIRYGTAKQAVQTAFYDVGKRVAELDKIQTGVPGNLARLEPRMNNAKSVSTNLGIGTLHQLSQLTDSDMVTSYVETVRSEVFRLIPATASEAGGQLFIPYSQGVYELKMYLDAYGSRGVGFRHYVQALGVDALLLRFGSFPGIREALQNIGMDRVQSWRIVKGLEGDYKRLPQTKKKAATMVDYLHEMHERFTTTAA